MWIKAASPARSCQAEAGASSRSPNCATSSVVFARPGTPLAPQPRSTSNWRPSSRWWPRSKQAWSKISAKFRWKHKTALVQRYHDQLIQGAPCIQSGQVEYRDVFTEVYYANSEGTYTYQERPTIDLQLAAFAREDSRVQKATQSLALAAGFEAIENRDDLVRDAIKLACDLLNAEPVRGGRYPVVLDPALAGLFIHEAFGHLSEADFIVANPQAQERMALGQQLGPSELDVSDDGSVPGLRGSVAFDDEGVPAQKTYLIRDGKLVGRLHSRETAAELGEQPTGNARATSYRFPPLVRMTNTAIEPGSGGSLADLIRDVELGLYACDWLGGEMAIDDFTFVAKYARVIRHGELAEMVRDVTCTGNVFETLGNIDRIGSDFSLGCQLGRLRQRCGGLAGL